MNRNERARLLAEGASLQLEGKSELDGISQNHMLIHMSKVAADLTDLTGMRRDKALNVVRHAMIDKEWRTTYSYALGQFQQVIEQYYRKAIREG
jgi:hypothetical protein